MSSAGMRGTSTDSAPMTSLSFARRFMIGTQMNPSFFSSSSLRPNALFRNSGSSESRGMVMASPESNTRPMMPRPGE